MVSEFVAIDPLALILPTSVYLKFVEKLHPNEPVLANLADVLKHLTPQEKAFVQARVRTLSAYTTAVEKAVGLAAAA